MCQIRHDISVYTVAYTNYNSLEYILDKYSDATYSTFT